MFILGALDSTMLLFLPFGIDALVVYLAARDGTLFWIYPLLAAAGSVTGAAVTFVIGQKVGEVGLERLVSRSRLERLRRRVRDGGAVALAVPALLPPPFPLTPFILTCGALEVSRWHFFGAFAGMRLARFGVEAVLARLYGSRVLMVLESDAFRLVVVGVIVVAVAGTTASVVMIWRSTQVRGLRTS